MIWSTPEIARAKELCITLGYSSTKAAPILSQEFGRTITRNAVIGALIRHGIRITHEDRTRRQRTIGHHNGVAISRIVKGINTTTNGGPPLDLSVTRLLKSDATVVPPADAQPLLIKIEGKLSANDLMGERACRWIFGDPLKHSACYCGRETLGITGKPYCPEHMAKVFSGAPASKTKIVEKTVSKEPSEVVFG